MLKIEKCKICASEKVVLLKSYHIDSSKFPDLLAALGKRQVVIHLALCGTCGFLFYDTILSDQEMERLYISEKRGVREKKTTTRAAFLEEKALAFVTRNVSLGAGKKILDIGAGDFSLLESLGNIYSETELSAINVSYEEEYFGKIKVFHEMLERSRIQESFDFVILSHIVEHIAHFPPFFSALRKIIHPESKIYVEIPYQLGFTLFLKRNFHTQHINYFSPETLTHLFQSQGYDLLNIEFDRSGYSIYGIPGIVRAVFQLRGTGKSFKKSTVLSTLRHLIDPTPYINTFILKSPKR